MTTFKIYGIYTELVKSPSPLEKGWDEAKKADFSQKMALFASPPAPSPKERGNLKGLQVIDFKHFKDLCIYYSFLKLSNLTNSTNTKKRTMVLEPWYAFLLNSLNKRFFYQ